MKSYNGRNEAGLTLVEMLIVVVMIGIMSGIAASKLDWTRYRADSVIRGVAAALAQAQRTAVSLQMDVRVTVLGGDRLRIHEDGNNNSTIDTGERVTFSVLEHEFTLGKGTMANLPAPAIPAELTTLVFRRDGSSSAGGSFYLSSPNTDPTCKWCRGIALARVTSRMEIYSHATGSWKRGN